jgi:hypothetical protein
MRRNPVLTSDISGRDLTGVDGTGIVCGAPCLAPAVKVKVPAIDLVCANRLNRPIHYGHGRVIRYPSRSAGVGAEMALPPLPGST